MAYIKSDQNQNWLISPSLKDMIPEDHVCFLVDDFANDLNYSKFDEKSEGAGAPSYHPRILTKILLQGSLSKVRSSRKLATACCENIVFMYLSEKTKPDFSTIARFRRDNASFIEEAFKKTIKLAADHDLVDLNLICIDGTTIKANASKKSIVNKEKLDLLDKAIEKMIQEDIELDKLEEEMYGDREINLTGMDRKDMRRIVHEYTRKNKDKAKKKVNKLQKEFEKDPKQKRLSLTDSDSRFLRNKKHFSEPSYNAQFSVDAKHQIIIANDICQEQSDFRQLIPQIANIEENIGPLVPGTKIAADCGYGSGDNYHFLEEKELDGYIPNKAQAQKAKAGKQTIFREDYEYDWEKDEIIRDGIRLPYHHFYIRKDCGKKVLVYQKKGAIKRKQVPEHFRSRLRMKAKMETPEAKELYSRRRSAVEPPIGNIKHNLGFQEFLTRGINSVKTELNLVSIAHNLQKIWKSTRKSVESISGNAALRNLLLRFRLHFC